MYRFSIFPWVSFFIKFFPHQRFPPVGVLSCLQWLHTRKVISREFQCSLRHSHQKINHVNFIVKHFLNVPNFGGSNLSKDIERRNAIQCIPFSKFLLVFHIIFSSFCFTIRKSYKQLKRVLTMARIFFVNLKKKGKEKCIEFNVFRMLSFSLSTLVENSSDILQVSQTLVQSDDILPLEGLH